MLHKQKLLQAKLTELLTERETTQDKYWIDLEIESLEEKLASKPIDLDQYLTDSTDTETVAPIDLDQYLIDNAST